MTERGGVAGGSGSVLRERERVAGAGVAVTPNEQAGCGRGRARKLDQGFNLQQNKISAILRNTLLIAKPSTRVVCGSERCS
jgi:hypothetical protein